MLKDATGPICVRTPPDPEGVEILKEDGRLSGLFCLADK